MTSKETNNKQVSNVANETNSDRVESHTFASPEVRLKQETSLLKNSWRIVEANSCGGAKTKTRRTLRKPFEFSFEELRQTYEVPLMRPSTSPYEDDPQLTGAPANFDLTGSPHYSGNLDGYERDQMRAFFVKRPSFGLHFVIGLGGYPVAYATLTMHRHNPMRRHVDEPCQQLNPCNYLVIATMYDTISEPWTPSQYFCMSAPLPSGDYRLVQMMPESGKTRMVVIKSTNIFGKIQFPTKLMKSATKSD